MQELQFFDWRLLSLDDFGVEFQELRKQALLADEPNFLVQMASPMKPTSPELNDLNFDRSNGILLLSSEETEDVAKGTNKIGP